MRIPMPTTGCIDPHLPQAESVTGILPRNKSGWAKTVQCGAVWAHAPAQGAPASPNLRASSCRLANYPDL